MSNTLLNMRGTWDDSTQYISSYYGGCILTGLDYTSCDAVFYNNNLYAILDGTPSTIGTTPDEDSAFTLISSTAASAYGLLTDFALTTSITTGSHPIVFTLAGTMTSTANITYSNSIITLPNNRAFMVNYNIALLSGSSSAGTIELAGNNITINSDCNIEYSENTDQVYIGSAIITTASTGTPTLYLYGSGISGTTLINIQGSYISLLGV